MLFCLAVIVGCGSYTHQYIAPPSFSLPSGTYASQPTLTITDSNYGVNLYYTSDGTMPNTSSHLYTAPISLSESMIIQAIACQSSDICSNVTSYTYNMPPYASGPVFDPSAGTYVTTQNVEIKDQTPGSTIYFTTDGTPPTSSSPQYKSPLNISSTTTVRAIAYAPDYTSSQIASATFTITPPAEKPTFSPNPGEYPLNTTVTISDPTIGSTIYYTLDGTTPTISSAVYTTPITIGANTTISAAAIAPGYSLGPTTKGSYTIPTPTLSISPATQQIAIVQGASMDIPFMFTGGGSFSGPITLSISTLSNGVSATWNNSAPDNNNGTATSTLHIYVEPTTPASKTPITITAAGDGIVQSQTINLQITRAQLTFSFTVENQNTHTSAGVFDSSGALVRTLWSNQVFSPGTYTGGWNGNTDLGIQVPNNGPFTIKVLTNNVQYKWDGVVGTTSDSWFVPQRPESFGWNGNRRFAFVGKVGWMSSGYAEGSYNFGYFMDTDPNTAMMVNPYNPEIQNNPITSPYDDQNIGIIDIATDGQWIYLASQAFWDATSSYVTAFDVSVPNPNQAVPAVFGNGAIVAGPNCPLYPLANCGMNPGSLSWFNTTISYIDSEPSGQLPPTGIAVQHQGNILAVAHGDYPSNGSIVHSGVIRLFDKRQGTLLGIINSIPNPTQMAFNSLGLWVISNGSLYLVSDPGGSNQVSSPISSLSNALSVATDSSTDDIFILDGGTSQQMKEYNNSLVQISTYGVLGGYEDCNPTIRNDHLMLDGTAVTGQHSTLAGSNSSNVSWIRIEDATGDVWIQEGGTQSRILHLSPIVSTSGMKTYTYVNQILNHIPNYSATTSETMPTRLFSGLFEYSVSYDPNLPLESGDPDPTLGGNGAWSLTKNWAVCADGAAGSPVTGISSGSIYAAEKLNNGKAYVEISSGQDLFVYRLSDDGMTPMSPTTTYFSNFNWKQLFRDGSLGYTNLEPGPQGFINSIFQMKLVGFDSQDNPIWNSSELVAQVNSDIQSQPHLSLGWNTPFSGIEPTTDGYFPLYMQGYNYNYSSTTNLPHLGGVISGKSTFQWTAMPEVCINFPDNQGGFPCTKSFGGHDGIGPERTEGMSIFVMYDGQYASYGDQIYQFWEDGLLVGQFGNDSSYLNRIYNNVAPGQAGNIAAFSTVMVNGDVYVYHSDEAVHTPIHRWHVSNLQSVHELYATGLLGASSVLELRKL